MSTFWIDLFLHWVHEDPVRVQLALDHGFDAHALAIRSAALESPRDRLLDEGLVREVSELHGIARGTWEDLSGIPSLVNWAVS